MTATSRGSSTLVSAASILSAVVSSACCWLPLALLVVGVSATGVAAAFEIVRSVFLVVSAVFLGAGFYLNYFRREKCAPGTSCEQPRPRFRKFNRIMLWVATVMVLAFAFLPNYISALVGGNTAIETDELNGEIVLRINGMTCAGCELAVQKAISSVEGVNNCRVEYESRKATVMLERNAVVDNVELRRAVESVGYEVNDGLPLVDNE